MNKIFIECHKLKLNTYLFTYQTVEFFFNKRINQPLD